jgi:peptidyl-prolyl cis-trans isomerase C
MRGALLGLAMTGLTAFAQAPPARPTTPPTPAPAKPAPTTPAPTPLPPPTKVITPPAPVVSPTAVAATVNGENILEMTVQRALDRVPPAKRDDARKSLLDMYINNLLIDQSLRAAGYKADPADVDKNLNEMREKLKKVGRDFGKMLAEMKISEAELRQHVAADLRWYKYASAQATDAQLKQLFTQQKEMFDQSAVRARHILITPAAGDEKAFAAAGAELQQVKKAVEAEVAAGLAKLPATTDKLGQEKARGQLTADAFAKYAKEKSQCPTKANGGDVGWFGKVGFMVASFSEAAFKLQPNQMSEPVRTPFGVHLILVTERRPGKDVKFEEVKEAVKEAYFDRLHESLSGQLRPKAKIAINPPPK